MRCGSGWDPNKLDARGRATSEVVAAIASQNGQVAAAWSAPRPSHCRHPVHRVGQSKVACRPRRSSNDISRADHDDRFRDSGFRDWAASS